MTERDLAKQVICALIEAADGKLVGKMKLVKGFYHAHIAYWKLTQGQDLTRHPIVHLPDGPCIDEHENILDELERERAISISIREWGKNGKEYTFTLNRPSGISHDSIEYLAIADGYAKVKHKNVPQLKRDSHLRSWHITKIRCSWRHALTTHSPAKPAASLPFTAY
jgi:hypothetical protein